MCTQLGLCFRSAVQCIISFHEINVIEYIYQDEWFVDEASQYAILKSIIVSRRGPVILNVEFSRLPIRISFRISHEAAHVALDSQSYTSLQP